MRLSLGIRTSEAISQQLALSLGFPADEIPLTSLDVCGEFSRSATTPQEFAEWYLRASVFSKYLSDGDDDSRREAAIATFEQNDMACHTVNARLVDPWSRASLTTSVWLRASAIIRSVLGPFVLDELPELCNFGPGASSEFGRRNAFHQNKWELSTHITERALPYYDAFRKWSALGDVLPIDMNIVDSNKVFTVPKRYDTDRTCAAEPTWNMFLQKGVGKMIRRRLQRVGLLRQDAQETNRALARLGSWTDSLATLDLKAASDMLTTGLVEALMPPDWFKVLWDLRSDWGTYRDLDGNTAVLRYGKFSSMGNGFTFELETLVFYALTLAVCGKGNQHRVSVFGDDIICPREHAEAVSAILAEAGFTTNDSKSFVSGPFRESCGGHYWRGVDVTPFYLRRPVSDVGQAIVLHNHLHEWASRFPALNARFTPVVKDIRRVIPKALRGPWGLDGVAWDSWDRCTPYWKRRFQAYRQMRVATVTSRADFSDRIGGLVHALWAGTEEWEASWGSVPRGKLRLQATYVCRDMWILPPVRLA